jgi:hypothetical protein
MLHQLFPQSEEHKHAGLNSLRNAFSNVQLLPLIHAPESAKSHA